VRHGDACNPSRRLRRRIRNLRSALATYHTYQNCLKKAKKKEKKKKKKTGEEKKKK
jgi:hypothetical protein